MSYHRRALATQPIPDEIERLIYYMPIVASQAENTWAEGFAMSVVNRAPAWMAKAMQNSGAGDLLRNYRRA